MSKVQKSKNAAIAEKKRDNPVLKLKGNVYYSP